MSTLAQELSAQVNKRLTLNLLIQGSAQHAFLTAHYLVRDELMALHPDLVMLYDQFAAAAFLSYWSGLNVLICGRPATFWKRLPRTDHLFARHPLLCRYGGTLATAARARAIERCRQKGVTRTPVLYSFRVTAIAQRLLQMEARHKVRLEILAKRATEIAWGISQDRLDATLTRDVAFGKLSPPRSFTETLLRASVVGYGGVLRSDGQLRVVAKGWVWPLLAHELVKGVTELICLHGLNEWDETTYRQVMTTADRFEYEPWMLQTGSELWRRLLQLLPRDRSIAEALMHIARLPPDPLNDLMTAIMEDPNHARELIATLGDE